MPIGDRAGVAAASGRAFGIAFKLLDVVIAFGRKVAGFCALLTLGALYARILVLGQSLHRIYPDAPDPALRQTLVVALLLIMAQGWDIPTDRIAHLWRRLAMHLPARQPLAPRHAPLSGNAPTLARGVAAAFEPIVVHLGRFMDLCVAIANKIGAFAVLLYLVWLAIEVFGEGLGVRDMYPRAADPTLSFLADLCVYVVVLGWWATPFEEIERLWRRLRGRETGPRIETPDEKGRGRGPAREPTEA